MINRSFWKGRRVFLTGHTGFKGSWLSAWLLELGAQVFGYSLDAPSNPNIFSAAKLCEELESMHADVRDFEKLQGAINRFKPEIVLHLAAQALVRPSYKDPLETFSTNVMGTAAVLEACRHSKDVRAVVIVTSDKCYDNREWLWGYRENDPMGGHDPYSASKGCAELVRESFMCSYFAPEKISEHGKAVASARAGNVIGGGDWAEDRLIPDLVRGYVAGSSTVIRNPKASRPWQHVLDPLCGYLMLAERLYRADPKACGAWNFGPAVQSVASVGTVATKFVKYLGSPAAWHFDSKNEPHEAFSLKLDCSKAISQLAWQPLWGLDQTLQRTARWYQNYYLDRSAESVRAELFKDIRDYSSTQIFEVDSIVPELSAIADLPNQTCEHSNDEPNVSHLPNERSEPR